MISATLQKLFFSSFISYIFIIKKGGGDGAAAFGMFLEITTTMENIGV